MRELIEAAGAEVRISGDVWDEAHAAAITLAEKTGGVLPHPFDHPDIWEGHASLVAEVAETGLIPKRIVVAVGGGGLLSGVLQGMRDVGWSEVPVIAVETEGAASFSAALQAKKVVTLKAITSLALTLGSKRVCDRAFELSKAHDIRSVVVSDSAAVKACSRFLDDHRILVEPSCGAALSVVYDRHVEISASDGPVLVIVCGGAAVTQQQLEVWLQTVT
jgi:L-serine/L-threonine ammonia-lyase